MRGWLSGVLVLLVLFCGCIGSEDDVALETFTSKDDGFSILMPGTPELETHTVNTVAGPITVYVYQVESNGIVYQVGYNDYPEEAMEGLTPEQMLDGARDGAVANVFGELIAEEIISLNGYPGRQINIAVEDNGIRAKIFLVDNRLYQVLVVGPKNKMYYKNVGDVLDSFELID